MQRPFARRKRISTSLFSAANVIQARRAAAMRARLLMALSNRTLRWSVRCRTDNLREPRTHNQEVLRLHG